MKLHCWGTRGNVPTPGADTIGVGGNTSCYELRIDDGRNLIVDCGSGLIEYASSLLSRAPGAKAASLPREHHLLISHLHWDHILGFPFFHPIHVRGVSIHLYSAFPAELLARHMEALFDGTYSPLRAIDNLAADVRFHQIPTHGSVIAGVRIDCAEVDHTTPSYAFRVEHGGRVFGYASDHEVRDTPRNASVVELVRGADLLVHDAQYTADEYARHIGWGHSSIEAALDNAERAGVGRVLLSHHEPRHSDAYLEAYVAELNAVALRGPAFELAREGQDYDV